jgi:hypothetical protein
VPEQFIERVDFVDAPDADSAALGIVMVHASFYCPLFIERR